MVGWNLALAGGFSLLGSRILDEPKGSRASNTMQLLIPFLGNLHFCEFSGV